MEKLIFAKYKQSSHINSSIRGILKQRQHWKIWSNRSFGETLFLTFASQRDAEIPAPSLPTLDPLNHHPSAVLIGFRCSWLSITSSRYMKTSIGDICANAINGLWKLCQQCSPIQCHRHRWLECQQQGHLAHASALLSMTNTSFEATLWLIYLILESFYVELTYWGASSGHHEMNVILFLVPSPLSRSYWTS